MFLFLSTLFYFLCLSTRYSNAQEGCPQMITRTLLQTEMARTSQLRPSGEGATSNITVLEAFLTCLAAGSIRGNYREATYAVRFTGVPNQPANTEFFGIVDVVCFERSSTRFWEINSQNPFSFIDNTTYALLSNNDTVRRDCQRCNAPNHPAFRLDPNRDDLTRHCKLCPDACLADNLTLCYGSRNEQCCNVYIESPRNVFRCAVECPTNYTANEATEYVCRCDLGCQRGGRNNDQCDMCICPQNTTGPFCETLLDICDPNPCQNGGTCNRGTYPEYTCTCPPGFTGVNCSIELDPCQDMPCLNGATCESAGTYPAVTCICPPGFTGTRCETEICGNLNCLNGGVCEVQNGRPVCRCRDNFVGVRCENCTIPNCKTCSLNVRGVCLDCITGFLLSNGSCVLDCTLCSNITDVNQRGICNFFCELRSWREESRKCNVTSPSVNIPSPSLGITQQYAQAVSAAQGAEVAWSNGITLTSVMTPMRPNNTLETWRSATIQWVNNIRVWLTHIQTVDNSFSRFNLTNILNDINDDSRAQEVHTRIRSVWIEMFNEFNSKKRCDC